MVQQIVSGLVTGSLYAAFGLALFLVLQATGVLNLAQGEMATFSAFIAWTVLPGGFALALLTGALTGVILGALVYVVVMRVLDKHHEEAAIMGSIGLLFLFNSLTLTVWDADPRSFPTLVGGLAIDTPALKLPWQSVVVILTIAVILGALFWMLYRTGIGLAMRAAARDSETASLFGIDTRRMKLLGWCLSGAIGSIAGIFIASSITLSVSMMMPVLGVALVALVVGGVSTPVGVIFGGFVVGVAQNLIGTYARPVLEFVGINMPVNDTGSWRDIGMVAVLLLILLVRPQGLLGHKLARSA
jgi:branched-chain amino acid transport system permease protein